VVVLVRLIAAGGTVYKWMLINTFYKLERKFKNRADWEKSINPHPANVENMVSS
jgi:hypothetical protein